MGRTPKMEMKISETMRIPIIRSPDPTIGSNNNNCITMNNNNINNSNHIGMNDSRLRLDLPKPSFRLKKPRAYMKRRFTAKKFRTRLRLNQGVNNKDTYFLYTEPSAEELNRRLEYDMDQTDIEWLKNYNANHSECFKISENEFEKIMDRLEKESYFEGQKNDQLHPPVNEDAVCSICDDGDCNNANVILFCDMCDLAVHQECYGVPYIPEGHWLCRRCLLSPLRNVQCELCPNVSGAFKQTDDNKWAHVICAIWIPEVSFANTVFLEPIENLNLIHPDRRKLNCYICKQRKVGACIQCMNKNCYQAFHVTCAQQAKLYMKISQCEYTSKNGSFMDVKREIYCDKHTPKDANTDGGMYSCEETDEEDEGYLERRDKREKQLKQTRKILATKRALISAETEEATQAFIKVDEDKLAAIAKKCFSCRGKGKCVPKKLKEIGMRYVEDIYGYWRQKRMSRNGVPLIRRLQVLNHYHSNDAQGDQDLDKERFERLRYDLEKCRLLLGLVKKREQIKKLYFMNSLKMLPLQMDQIDANDPPEFD